MLSNFQLAFRAAIMLITLIVVPLVAVFGKSLPDYVQAWWRARDISANWQSHPTSHVDAPKADSFKEQLAAQSQRTDLQAAPLSTAGQFSPRSGAPSSAQATNIPATSNPPSQNLNASNIAASNFNQPNLLSPPAPAVAQASPLVNGSNAQLENRIADINVSPTSLQPGVTQNGPQPTTQADSFQTLEKQLRESGATYYKLEATPQGYHFYCQALGAAQEIHEYQAASGTPVAAMQDVLRQLETGRRIAEPGNTHLSALQMRPIQ